jgi:2-polyprenyl-3-methyl-5-hydroxy-6-metoxy-1,4-benzoquinol methylase
MRLIPWSKTVLYKRALAGLFDDVWSRPAPISWLDIGAGFGEIVEAVKQLAPRGSCIEGLEPMQPKAVRARERGLTIHNCYLDGLNQTYDFASLVNVFSHLPDFREFLSQLKAKLTRNGQLFLETGNVADMRRQDFSGVLSLPDHLVFAGEKHIVGYLEQGGFRVLKIVRHRVDTPQEFLKDIARKCLGQPVRLRLPYSSPYRSLLIRATRVD